MTSRRRFWIALAGLAIFGLAGYAFLDCATLARAGSGACRARCKEAYARCYKATGGNRQICDARLARCLEGCLRRYRID